MYTQEYWLKYSDVTLIVRAINITVRDAGGKRIIGGQGNHLVVTATEDEQLMIADLLPILDQPTQEKRPDKTVIDMVTRAAHYLKDKKLAFAAAQKANNPAPANAPVQAAGYATPTAPHVNVLSSINSFDLYKTTFSIYAQEDARIVAKRIIKDDEGGLPSLGDLTLRGIFKVTTGSPLALLTYAQTNYTARDGGLFERNRTRVKDVSSKVFKDRVVLVGPDRIQRVFKFKSSI